MSENAQALFVLSEVEAPLRREDMPFDFAQGERRRG